MNIDALQQQISIWMKFNFGSNDQHGPSHWPLLAIVEETSELIESFDSNTFKKEARDAIADSMIACIGYCDIHSWNAQELWNDKVYLPDINVGYTPVYLIDSIIRLNIIIGRLCREHLKKEQDIRGSLAEHNTKGRRCIQELMQWFIYMYDSLHLGPPSFIDNLTDTWLKVRKRNFVDDPANGNTTKLEWND